MSQAKRPGGGRAMGSLEGVALAAVMLPGLAGCGTADDQGAAPGQPCPRVALLEGAARLTVPPGDAPQDPQALRYVAALSGIRSTCQYTDGGVEVDVGFNVLAERGPALQGDSIDLSYFVATVAPDQTISSKQMLGAEITFAEGQQTAGVVETLTLRLPVSSPAEGTEHALYIGFQLDRAGLQSTPPPLPR